jgi:hypothetical protein
MAEKKKPKPGPSTGGSSTSRIKKPKGSQPLTLGTGGLRTGKVSKKQMAGTRKVVGAIAAVTPVGRLATGAVKASRTTGIAGHGASKTAKQSFGKYATRVEVKSKTARKIGDKISGASSKKVQKRLNKYAIGDEVAGRIERGWGNHPGWVSYKGYKKVIDPKANFPTARQSVRWRKAEDKAETRSTKRALKSVNTKKYTKKK